MTSNCKICGNSFAWEQPTLPSGRVLDWSVTICDSCEQSNAQPDAITEEMAEKRAKFLATIPRIFRETDLNRLPKKLTDAVASWKFGPKGLAFVGASGLGKTRAMYALCLREVALHSVSVDFITATDLANCATEQFSDDPCERNAAKSKLRWIRNVKILFLDDLGKGKLTDRTETELFSLLDARTGAGLPTLWTSNLGRAELASMSSQNRGEPLLRRLTEFTEIVSV